jgi:anaerobic selenocysteine-containing dehydrogenase/Fe-S-cluster-containing dehydrogenase component
MSEGMKRRDFLKVMGVGGAGAVTAGCSTGEVERLIPYVIPAEEIVPGVPTYYASTCRECPAGCGILVETHSGRATKVEGNPNHPVSRGNLCARGQASVQGLYHPDRYQGPATLDPGLPPHNVTWGTAESLLAQRIREARPGAVVLLTGSYGGAMDTLADQWAASVGARRVVYDSFADQPRDLQFADADVLVSFGADFLETWGSPVDYSWQFAQFRTVRNGRRGKFVWVGPHRPLTGLNADQWIAPRPGTEVLVAQALSGAVAPGLAARETGIPEATLAQLAQEFSAGRGVAMGGGAGYAGPFAGQLRAAVAQLNGQGAGQQRGGMEGVARLAEEMRAGAVDVLLIDAADPVHTLPGGLRFGEAMQGVRTRVSFSSFPDDTSRLCTLILPSHHFLEAWGDYAGHAGVRSIVQPAMRPVFNTKQPGDVLLSVARVLQADGVGNGATTFYDYLRQQVGGDDAAWRQALQSGLAAGGAAQVAGRNGNGNGAAARAKAAVAAAPTAAQQEIQPAAPAQVAQPVTPAQAAPPAAAAQAGRPAGAAPATFEGPADANFHLVVYPSYRFFDGRTANRPWLLELPDPVTKVAWESWVEVHPVAAEQMNVRQGDLVEIASQHGTIEIPVYVYPGVRQDTVAIQMGLGHQEFGRYTRGRGVNPNLLLGAAVDPGTGDFVHYGTRVRVRRTGRRHRFFEAGSRVQHDRDFVQAVSITELARRDASYAPHVPGEGDTLKMLRGRGGFAAVPVETDPAGGYPPPGSRHGEYHEGQPRWAMAVDLQRCIGCSACVTACYAENNIPVVGPDQVHRGREMAWLRIERYFGVTRNVDEAYADGATDDVRFLPMLCQHCGNAPCEPVCPVYAAYHTPDGLNAQVYNRCVGTRYCANNCPYKVRYFNWFTHEFTSPLNWQLNPDVTVRDKGVMEKCTFCVQRIHEANRNAAREMRPVRDGEVVPACVQTCPAEVFVFGNIADPDSAVAAAARSNRSYRVLEEINTQPAVVYLQKVTLQEPAHGSHYPAAGQGYAESPYGAHEQTN